MRRGRGLTVALTTFELGMLILGFIAVLGWLYLVWKISALVDNISKTFEAALGAVGTVQG